MQWKLLLLLAWLVVGGGGCRTGVSPRLRRRRGEQDHLLRAIDDALTRAQSVTRSVP